MKSIKFIIHAKPVSINNAYFTNRRGGRTLSEKGKTFKDICWLEANNAALAHGIRMADKFKYPIQINIDLFLDSLHRSDVDNYIKLIQDGLSDVFFTDDRQIKRVQAEKHLDKLRQRVEVELIQL